MKDRTVCFTGHRNIAKAVLPQLERLLDETIAELICQGIVYFGSGAARGFDTIAARAVLRARERNPAIKLILVLPCRDQDARWPEADRHEYQTLLAYADKTLCLSEHYYNGCMEARNRHLVSHSSVCVAYMKHGRSGTSQTVRLANEQGLTVMNLLDKLEE